MGEGHVIQRQILEVDLPAGSEGTVWHAQLAELAQEKLKPILDQLVSRFDDPRVLVRLEKLELDLGDLTLDNWQEELPQRLEWTLERELSAAMHPDAPQATYGSKQSVVQRTPQVQGLQELLVQWLATGTRPWWGSSVAKGTLPELVTQALENQPASTSTQINERLRKDAAVLRRLVRQLPPRLFYAALLGERPTQAHQANTWTKAEEILAPALATLAQRIASFPSAEKTKLPLPEKVTEWARRVQASPATQWQEELRLTIGQVLATMPKPTELAMAQLLPALFEAWWGTQRAMPPKQDDALPASKPTEEAKYRTAPTARGGMAEGKSTSELAKHFNLPQELVVVLSQDFPQVLAVLTAPMGADQMVPPSANESKKEEGADTGNTIEVDGQKKQRPSIQKEHMESPDGKDELLDLASKKEDTTKPEEASAAKSPKQAMESAAKVEDAGDKKGEGKEGSLRAKAEGVKENREDDAKAAKHEKADASVGEEKSTKSKKQDASDTASTKAADGKKALVKTEKDLGKGEEQPADQKGSDDSVKAEAMEALNSKHKKSDASAAGPKGNLSDEETSKDSAAGGKLPTPNEPKEPYQPPKVRRVVEYGEELYIENAGLVLIWPFITHFFKGMELVNAANDWVSAEAHERAVFLLQGLLPAEVPHEEPDLILNKVLTGWPLGEPLHAFPEFTAEEQEELTGLLQAVVAQWGTLGNTSPENLAATFLVREGRLQLQREHEWVLRVHQRPFDVLLDSVPWPRGVVRMPWTQDVIFVEW